MEVLPVPQIEPAPIKPVISARDVEKLDVRVGTILAVEGFPNGVRAG
jgi:hypothetical protein